jgi:hypothetical protein
LLYLAFPTYSLLSGIRQKPFQFDSLNAEMPSALRRIAPALWGSNSACIEQGGALWTTRHLRHHPQHAD